MRPIRDLLVTVFTGSFAVGGNGAAANDFDITDELAKFPWVGPVTLQIVAARTGGSSTTDLNILESLDGGTTYSVVLGLTNNASTTKTFTQISGATGDEGIVIAPPSGLALYKTDINLGSGTTTTITVYAAGKIAGQAMMA